MIPHPAQTNPSSPTDGNIQAVPAGEDASEPADVHPEISAALGRAPEGPDRPQGQKLPSDHRALLDLGYLARQRGDALAALGYFEAAAPERPGPGSRWRSSCARSGGSTRPRPCTASSCRSGPILCGP
jgi:hypothetical protein